MSVIVFDFREGLMYGDMAVTLGSTYMCSMHKVQRFKIGDMYNVLAGGIGYPDFQQLQTAFVRDYLENLSAFHDDLVETLEDGTMHLVNGPLLRQYRESIDNAYKDATSNASDSTTLVAVQNIETGRVVVGIIPQGLSIFWGVKALSGDQHVIVGSPEMVTAFNATDRNATMSERLEKAGGVVQSIGGRKNKICKYSFYGEYGYSVGF